eukprot:g383.t1
MQGPVKLPLAERGTSDAPNIEFWDEYANASDVLTVDEFAQPASTYTLFHTARKPSHAGQPARTYWFQMSVRAFPYKVTDYKEYDSWRRQADRAVSEVQSLAPINWSSCALTDMRFYDIDEGRNGARQINLDNSHHFWGSDLAFYAEKIEARNYLKGEGPFAEDQLPSRTHSVKFVQINKLELSPGARLTAVVDPRPRWITYGSSITHCAEAHSPSRTWPALAARMANVRLLSFGVGGQCHMDQYVARMIRDTPADCISLKLGINVHNFTSLGIRTFMSSAFGFIATVRDGHPLTPIVVISPIASPEREQQTRRIKENMMARFPSLAQMRAMLERVVEALRAAGDEHVFYRSGLELFDVEHDAPTMPDGLHPDGDGYEVIGRRFAELEFGVAGRLLPGRVGQGVAKRAAL